LYSRAEKASSVKRLLFVCGRPRDSGFHPSLIWASFPYCLCRIWKAQSTGRSFFTCRHPNMSFNNKKSAQSKFQNKSAIWLLPVVFFLFSTSIAFYPYPYPNTPSLTHAYCLHCYITPRTMELEQYSSTVVSTQQTQWPTTPSPLPLTTTPLPHTLNDKGVTASATNAVQQRPLKFPSSNCAVVV
jgi:hypothetical protein